MLSLPRVPLLCMVSTTPHALRRPQLTAAIAGRELSFSVLVHSDTSSPMIDFLSSSSMLQVRADCPVEQLIEFMTSEVRAGQEPAG
jgi:hypothetical protein